MVPTRWDRVFCGLDLVLTICGQYSFRHPQNRRPKMTLCIYDDCLSSIPNRFILLYLDMYRAKEKYIENCKIFNIHRETH